MWIPLLLAESSPILRWLIHSKLLNSSLKSTEMIELSKIRYEDSLIKNLLKIQRKDGSWSLNNADTRLENRLYQTSAMLWRLAFYGFTREEQFVQNAAEFIFSQQKTDGSWNYSINDPEDPNQYDWVPLRTAFPLRALASIGYATDKRSLMAYQRLLSHQLEDGGFPTGQRKNKLVLPAGYRRIPHSKFACRTNTILSLECFAFHPEYKYMEIMKRGLDLVLSRETFDRNPLGLEVARRIGVHPVNGFFTYYAKHDLAVILNLAWRLGANKSDERIQNIVIFLKKVKTSYGIWEYKNHPHISRWITYDLLFSLKQLDQETHWISLEPHTPFKMYNHPPKRF